MAERRTRGDGALFQRGRKGSGRLEWVARVEHRGRDGKRVRREFTGATPDAVMAKRDAFLALRRDGFTLPKGREPSVSDWMLHWLHNVAKREVAPTTWHKSYRQKVTDLICPYFATVPLSQLSEEDIETWHAELEATTCRTGQPYSAQTIKHAHRIMARAIKIAVVRKKIGHNPCSNVSPPTVDEIEIVPPTLAEVETVLAACEGRPDRARWVVGITTGLRQGEVLALEWQHVKLTSPAAVTVRQTAAWVQGERIVKAPKSKAGRRTVPILARTARALSELKREQAKARMAAGAWQDPSLVFTGPAGEPLLPWADYHTWLDLLGELGLPAYRVHDMRHFYATMLMEQGTDPRVVLDIMGWSTLTMLARYEHVRPVMHAAVVAQLDGVFGS